MTTFILSVEIEMKHSIMLKQHFYFTEYPEKNIGSTLESCEEMSEVHQNQWF